MFIEVVVAVVVFEREANILSLDFEANRFVEAELGIDDVVVGFVVVVVGCVGCVGCVVEESVGNFIVWSSKEGLNLV